MIRYRISFLATGDLGSSHALGIQGVTERRRKESRDAGKRIILKGGERGGRG